MVLAVKTCGIGTSRRRDTADAASTLPPRLPLRRRSPPPLVIHPSTDEGRGGPVPSTGQPGTAPPAPHGEVSGRASRPPGGESAFPVSGAYAAPPPLWGGEEMRGGEGRTLRVLRGGVPPPRTPPAKGRTVSSACTVRTPLNWFPPRGFPQTPFLNPPPETTALRAGGDAWGKPMGGTNLVGGCSLPACGEPGHARRAKLGPANTRDTALPFPRCSWCLDRRARGLRPLARARAKSTRNYDRSDLGYRPVHNLCSCVARVLLIFA